MVVARHIKDPLAIHSKAEMTNAVMSLLNQVAKLSERNSQLSEQSSQLTEQNSKLSAENSQVTEQNSQLVNRNSTVTHYQRPNMTHPQEGGTGGEVSETLFFSAKSKRRPSLIYPMQIIPVCLSIVARRKGVSATRRGGLNWTPISLLVGHPCKLFHRGHAGSIA